MIDLHDRVAEARGHSPEVTDPDALDRAVIAPQRAGGDAPSDRRLARKAAALYLSVTRSRPFRRSNARTAFAALSAFFHQNGAQLGLSFEHVRAQVDEAEDAPLDEESLAAVFARNLTPQPSERSSRRLLAALSRLADTIERLDEEPALNAQVVALDRAGHGISRAFASTVDDNLSNTLSTAYPSVQDRWGEAFSDSQ